MDELYTSPWYFLDWFSPAMFRAFTWETQWFLYLALASPLIFVIRWIIRTCNVKAWYIGGGAAAIAAGAYLAAFGFGLL